MAVDASQFLTNREIGDFVEGNDNIYSNVPLGYGFVPGPFSGTTTATEAMIPMYGGFGMADSVFAKSSVKSDVSGLSYAIPASRKRPRDSGMVNNHQFMSFPSSFLNQQNVNHFNFLSQDFSSLFQQQQSDIDNLIAQHALKMRLEMEEKRKMHSRRIMTVVEEVIVKRLRVKDEEIEKIGKLNWALDEKVKSLYLENQIWRELAQTNEATANALRSNLEQVIEHVQNDQQRHRQNTAVDDDAESCCGSNRVVTPDENNNHRYTNTGAAVDSGEASKSHGGQNVNINRMCRNCGNEEATVLIMPCRHLCLCYICGPLLQNCPVCNSTKNVMVRVNLVS